MIHIEGFKSEPLFSEQPSPEQISNKIFTGFFFFFQVITKEFSFFDIQDIASFATTVGIDSDVEIFSKVIEDFTSKFQTLRTQEPKNGYVKKIVRQKKARVVLLHVISDTAKVSS